MSSRKKAFIIDDEPLVRDDLRHMLRKHPEIHIEGEAESVKDGKRLLKQNSPDLVFLDVQESDNNTLSITGAVYDKSAITRIILNNRTLSFNQTNFFKVDEQFNRTELGNDTSIQFVAEDEIGNRTRGCINCDRSVYNRTSHFISSFPQVASSRAFALSS